MEPGSKILRRYSGRHIGAILWKQGKDTLKNKEILVQFAMFPLLTIVMEHFIEIEGMPPHFFAGMFGVMYLGMAPLICMAAILAEEKEKNTLRMLLLSNVKAVEYLLGTGAYVWTLCMLGAAVIGLAGGWQGGELGMFLLWMGIGILISVLLGAAIGIFGKNQMAATSLTVPVMLVISFLPMLSMFNRRIEQIARFVYSGRISRLIGSQEAFRWDIGSLVVLLGNALAAAALFAVAYRRRGLEN